MADDRYRSFAELKTAERYGYAYRIRALHRGSGIAVIAPHGGTIEPATSEIARTIAGPDLDFYSFEGLRRWPHARLHITSHRFDEPRCLRLIEPCRAVIAVHGLAGTTSRVDVGGRDSVLRDAVCSALRGAGFAAEVVSTGGHAAIDPANICNRGRSGAGVQLEITKGLRDGLRRKRERSSVFAQAVRRAIREIQADTERALASRSRL